MPITFSYSPHPAQLEIHRARERRFRTVCTGRRFGKTLCLAAELLDRGGCEVGGDYGWVAPTYNVADRGIEAFRTIAEGFVEVCGRAPSRVEFTGKAGPVRVWFLSADNPDNIRGFGFQGLVIDEAASISQDVWHYVLRPTIAQTLGWAVFVSTPKGRNWFYDLFTRGLDGAERDYASLRFPSNASPYFPEKEWEEARRTLPEDVFRQEYMAEFLEDSAGVFRNVEGCLLRDEGGNLKPEGGVRSVVVGCDVAKHTDWTVLVAMDAETGRCFGMERFNQLDWPIQKERIVAFARKHRGRVILDATGVGDPIFDDLRRVLPDIEGYRLTAGSKTELIQRLIVAVEQARVSWPAGRCQGSGFRVQGGGNMQAAFREESRDVISPHLPRCRESRGYVSSETRDALHPGQADAAFSSSPRGSSGRRNAACGSSHAAVRHETDERSDQGVIVTRATVCVGAARRQGVEGPPCVAPAAQAPGAMQGACQNPPASRDYGAACWEVLTSEMRRYEYAIGPSGAISYGAPAGFHDDCVMALALANHGRWERENCGRMLTVFGQARMRTARVRRRERCLVG